jgi:hypothetical protein
MFKAMNNQFHLPVPNWWVLKSRGLQLRKRLTQLFGLLTSLGLGVSEYPLLFSRTPVNLHHIMGYKECEAHSLVVSTSRIRLNF